MAVPPPEPPPRTHPVATGPGWGAVSGETVSDETFLFPKPASWDFLTRSMLVDGGSDTLGEAADNLVAALRAADYNWENYKFYEVPDGFVLVTELERIDATGTPECLVCEARWSTDLPPRTFSNFFEILAALGSAPVGHYRVLAFLVTDARTREGSAAPSLGDAVGWVRSGGSSELPAHIRRLPFNPEHRGRALLYQFRKIGHYQVVVNPRHPRIPQHLRQTGIHIALED